MRRALTETLPLPDDAAARGRYPAGGFFPLSAVLLLLSSLVGCAPIVRIAAEEAMVLAAPRESATAKGEVYRGERYEVVNEAGDWLKIRLDDGSFGYVSRAATKAHPAKAAQPRGQPGVQAVLTNAKDGTDLVYIPAGEFMMGSPDDVGSGHEHPRHAVYLDGYFVARNEATVGQFRRFAAETGRQLPDQHGHGDADPVINVTWDDATAYCRWAGLRLPTEAEWEKAARAGSQTAYWWGDVASHQQANFTGTGGADRWDDVSPAGSFPPNAYGVHDTAGNVWEWCGDWYDAGYYAVSPAANPNGPVDGDARVLRGGCWDSPADWTRSAKRSSDVADYSSTLLGFRCARSK